MEKKDYYYIHPQWLIFLKIQELKEASIVAKPLIVDEVWKERIASQLNDMEFGSLHIVVHEGQIVQMERTERKRFENTPGSSVKAAARAERRTGRESGLR